MPVSERPADLRRGACCGPAGKTVAFRALYRCETEGDAPRGRLARSLGVGAFAPHPRPGFALPFPFRTVRAPGERFPSGPFCRGCCRRVLSAVAVQAHARLPSLTAPDTGQVRLSVRPSERFARCQRKANQKHSPRKGRAIYQRGRSKEAFEPDEGKHRPRLIFGYTGSVTVCEYAFG